jgi:hypothetical protein
MSKIITFPLIVERKFSRPGYMHPKITIVKLSNDSVTSWTIPISVISDCNCLNLQFDYVGGTGLALRQIAGFDSEGFYTRPRDESIFPAGVPKEVLDVG